MSEHSPIGETSGHSISCSSDERADSWQSRLPQRSGSRKSCLPYSSAPRDVTFQRLIRVVATLVPRKLSAAVTAESRSCSILDQSARVPEEAYPCTDQGSPYYALPRYSGCTLVLRSSFLPWSFPSEGSTHGPERTRCSRCESLLLHAS